MHNSEVMRPQPGYAFIHYPTTAVRFYSQHPSTMYPVNAQYRPIFVERHDPPEMMNMPSFNAFVN
jgi:hypothetical protein